MPPQQMTYQQQYQNQPSRQLPIKLLLIVGGLVVIALFILNVFLNRSYLEVSVTGGEGTVSYELVDQADGSKVEVKDASTSFKRSVRKGSYELLVRQGGKSYFTVVNAGGFYGTVKVDAVVEGEKAREFIGDAPAACVNLVKNVLVSYECGGVMATLKTHVPATASLPTHLKANTNPPDDQIEGIVHTKEGDILVSYEALVAGHEEFGEGANEAHSPHNAFKLVNSDIELKNGRPLIGLDNNDIYSFQAYKSGFIAYRLPLTTVFYYPNLEASQETVDIGQSPEGYTGYFVKAQGDNLIAAFTPATEEGAREKTAEERFDEASEVSVRVGDTLKRFELPNTYTDLQLCGNDQLCVLGDDGVEIYDISGSKPELQFRVTGIESMLSQGDKLLLNRGNEILSLDLAGRTGYIQYGSSDYSVCGMQAVGNSYMVCITNSEDRRSVLRIDQSKPGDDIDDKVSALRGIPEVEEVSVYGKFIFVSPNAGERKYIPSLPGWGYDPNVVRRANDKINEKINELGIDRNTYKITSTQK